MMFPEDDEMDLENELENVEREIGYMEKRRHDIRKDLKRKQLDPITAKIAELAHQSGYQQGKREAAEKRISFLERRIKVRDEELERLDDRDALLARAEAAEATIARSKKRKRNR